MALVQKYMEVSKIYEQLDMIEVKDGVRKKLREGEDSARMSYELATICTSAPIEFKPEDALWNNDYKPELYSVLKRLGFNKFIENGALPRMRHRKSKQC